MHCVMIVALPIYAYTCTRNATASQNIFMFSLLSKQPKKAEKE